MLWCDDVSWDDSRSAAAQRRVLEQGAPLRPNMVLKFEREAKRHWDLFYKRNGARFFKER